MSSNLSLWHNINEDLSSLSHYPRGTHIGEMDFSHLEYYLPPLYLTRYDYEFLYQMLNVLKENIYFLHNIKNYHPQRVIDELVLSIALDESKSLMDYYPTESEDPWQEWCHDFCGDMDVETFLYGRLYLPENHSYHFDRWFEP